MTPEMLSSHTCSGSISTHTHQSPFAYRSHIQYLSCSATFVPRTYKVRGVVPVALSEGLRTSSGTPKKRIPESFSPCKSSTIIKEPCTAVKNQCFESNLSSEEVRDSRVWNEPNFENDIFYLEEGDERVLSKRILELSRCNRVRSALALHRSMKFSGLNPDSHACNSLVACLIRSKRVDEALNVFQFMSSKGIVTAHSYSLILKALADYEGHEAAVIMFEEAERNSKTKKHMDLIVYNTMIGIFGKVNNWSQAEKIWRTMQENGIVGSVITYRLLVCVFVRCDQNELALDAYNEMVRNRLTPCVDAMQAVIGACSREGKCDMALSVLQTMVDNGMKPSLTTCNALISMLGKTAPLEKTLEAYDLIVSFGHTPDAYSWNALLVAMNRADRYSDSLRLFDSIRKQHKHVLNLHIYNTCLVSCQRLGLWERAVQLLWDIEASGIRATVTSYNLAIGACDVAREPKAALQVYHHMLQQKHSPDSFTLLPLIRICIWGSLWREVETILDSTSNELLYNVAIQGLCLKKEVNTARKLYTKMCENGLNPDRHTRALLQQNLVYL